VADFFQNGSIATLHNLRGRTVDSLEQEMSTWGDRAPMALVIPSLFEELSRPALTTIVDELTEVPYLEEIIIGLDAAGPDDFADAQEFFSRLPQRTRIVWNDGPRLGKVQEELCAAGLAPETPGKGRNVWYCLGYFLASARSRVVAMHDADIVTYDRSMLARLLYPVAHPTFGYAFAKGYYYRSGGGTMNGRVARLLVTPLVRALKATIGPSDYLDYIDAFRYPLAGECAMHANLALPLRIPSDWGLEVGLLSEVHRRYTNERICQVDIADLYDHKHQDLSPDDASTGLHKMSIDISKAMFRKLAISGAVFSAETFRTIKASYYRKGLDLVDHYNADAVLNGLHHDRDGEERAVELFAQAIIEAGDQFLSNPMETPFIPSWSRVAGALPGLGDQLVAAVEADNS
jgi:glucosyl-3-phosphoglycerate synthase